MKSDRHFRERGSSEDLKKPTKLAPNRKSGKDRIVLDDEDEEIYRPERESVFDYFEDEDEL